MNVNDAHKVVENLKTRPFICSENTIELDNGYVIVKEEYFKELNKRQVQELEEYERGGKSGI